MDNKVRMEGFLGFTGIEVLVEIAVVLEKLSDFGCNGIL